MLIIYLLIFVNGIYCFQHSELDNVDEEEDDLDENLAAVNVIIYSENISMSTQPVDHSDEDWVRNSLLNVAYYLRAHKFNDFDRRYYKDTGNQEGFQYKGFPDPPLRYLHWEVYKYCDQGFYICLSYLQDIVLQTTLVRTLDTSWVMNEKRWEYPRNAKSIDNHYKECLRLKEIDWRDADPFKGPIERFQWRVSASYYMCFFTMQDLSPLVMFGERCDNFANCLEGKSSFNGDPRADDSKPYQCAMYSFCPDVCCLQKKIQDKDECLDIKENPCYWHTERNKRLCSFKREQNGNLASMAMNHWNLTCICDLGYVWESVFNACVDIDECYTGTHQCIPVVQICINLQGNYACVCAWGYINVSGSCESNNLLTTVLEIVHQHYNPIPEAPAGPTSLFHTFCEYLIKKLFNRNKNPVKPMVKSNETKIEHFIIEGDFTG